MKRFTIFICLFICSATSLFAQKRAFTLEDLYRIQGIGDPQISPEGDRIAFTVTKYNLREGTQNTNIWMMQADGSDPRQMTRSDQSDGHPRWSPDGTTLMFLSSRNDDSQIWLLPVTGGEPYKLTDISTSISDPIWTADGKSIVFASEVFPEYGAVDSLNKRDLESMEEGPVHAHMADELLYRHWTSWDDGLKIHTLIIDVDSGEMRDLTPGPYHAPRFSLGNRGFQVSPDSKELCVVSDHSADPWSSTNADLWVTPLDGGEYINITADNAAYDGDPLYSPNGQYIAYRKQLIPRYEADRFRLAIYDRETQTHRILTEPFDYWVEDFRWSPDSKTIYFIATVQGHLPLYSVDIRSGNITLVLDVKTINNFEISPDGKWMAITRRSIGEPTSLVRVQTDGKDLKRLEFFNETLENEVDIRPAEEMWVEGAEGHPVHVYIIKPHDFDPTKKYPTIMNIHGGPQSLWLDSFRGDWQVYPGAGYVLVLPNPHGSTGYGQDYTSAISKDWGGRVYEDIMKVTDAVSELPYVDADRMGAMGWSYGGYMMMWLQGHTDRFKAMACMMGVYDLKSKYGATEELWFPEWDLGGQPWNSEYYEKWSPSNFVENFQTPCLVITGELDYRVPYTQSLHFFTDLQKMHVTSRLIVFPNDGHWPNYVRSMPLYYNAHLDWFHKYLGGGSAPWDMTDMIRNRHFVE
ncbi:S9 family peptidase [bacterium]|nr:S9 family peptidase [bacterium]